MLYFSFQKLEIY